MSEADLHLKDLLSFYVEECHKELLSVSDDTIQVESMLAAIRRTREIILMMSCMIGAVTPGDIEAIRKISQVKLVAENEAAQMLRVGEDMALLRIWLKSAADAQWNVSDAVRLLRTGKPGPSSSFPDMTADLLRSVKKPFVVPSMLPKNVDSIRRILRTWIHAQFQRAKREPPFVPERVTLEFNDEDDSVTVSSGDEFFFRGIYDSRRWTIIEAQILDDVAGKPSCRQILQAISNSSLAEMCSAALRMATAQKLKLFQDEAVGLISESWSSVCAVSKSKAGLGNGFTVSLFKKLTLHDIKVNFEMDFENGDLKIEAPEFVEIEKPFSDLHAVLRSVEKQVRKFVLSQLQGILCCNDSALFIPDANSVVILEPSGTLTMTPQFASPMTYSESALRILKFSWKLHTWLTEQESQGIQVLAANTDQEGIDLCVARHSWNELISSITNIDETVVVCGIKTEGKVKTVVFTPVED